MCQLCEDGGFLGQIGEVRRDRSNRLLKLRVDSGATVTVVPKDHPATRGYKTWRDKRYGRMYRTAAKNQVRDEGLRVLQTKAKDGPSGLPLRMRTRKADVANALLSVLDLNRCGYFVGLDLERSFAIHKETGAQHFFEFDGESGWT